jgi:1A family penicillin-binding protein
MANTNQRQSGAALPFHMRLLVAAWRLCLAFAHIFLLACVALIAAAIAAYNHYGRDLPDPAAIGRYRPAETTYIYARDGETLLYELVDPQGGRRTVVPFERIPQVLKDATVAVEDAGFYENPGVDVRGIIRALLLNYEAGEVVSGGSTITQQLVRNVLLTPEERTDISLDRKLREAILAFRVSREYSKDQILGIYLNEVYYGSRAYGVEAAAQTYFGKHVWELSDAEATLIAGLPQSPTRLNPLINPEGARARQSITLGLMARYGFITAERATTLANTPLDYTTPRTPIVAPHFVYYVQSLLEQRYGPDVLYNGGLRVITSIDLSWQAEAERIVRERIAELRTRNATNAGVVMLAPNGEILAMVGSVDFNDPAIDGEVNVTLAARQPGSALKPIVYAAALQQGWTPATVIWDEPVSYPLSNGAAYEPQNYDEQFHGPQRLRMALANSLNIPAVKALEFVGVESFVELAHRMGITTLDDPQRFSLALALGAGEVRLLDLTTVYNTIRDGGRRHDPVAILRVINSRGQALESAEASPGRQALGDNGEQIAYLLTSILSDNEARRYMFGAGNPMELADGRPAAVKTGTSNEWRDSWAVGYTPDVTIGVWVGNSDNSPMAEVAGSNGAATIWRALMEAYHAGRPIRAFERPPGLSELLICGDTGTLAGDACPNPRSELFVAGTEPREANIRTVTLRVAGDGRCLPSAYTPIAEIRERTFLAYPPEFRAWAASRGIEQPPEERCPPPQPAVTAAAPAQIAATITFPTAGAVVTGTQVIIRGSAAGSYLLDVGEGAEPAEWRSITPGPPMVDGILGIWEPAGLPEGPYTLRLRVTLADGGTVETRTPLAVRRAP